MRASVSILFPLWIAACATAEDTGPGPDGAAGAAVPRAGMSAGGFSNPSAGAGGRFDGSAGAATAGSSAGGQSGAQAGAAGRGGAAGSAGAAGSSGAAGSGGAPPVFDPGACAASPTMSLQYLQGSTQAAVVTAQYQFTNTSDTPVPLGSLSIRYFFSNEETSAWKSMVYDANIKGSTGSYQSITGATVKVAPLDIKADGADTYAELSFPTGNSLEKGATVTVKWELQPTSYDPPNQTQANDYSYNAAASSYTVWDHVAIYQGAALVWGCLPKAAGGSAGSSGAGGSASSGGGAGGRGGTGGTGGSKAGGGGTTSAAGAH